MVIEKMIFQSPSKTSSNISNSQLEYRVLAFSQSAEEAKMIVAVVCFAFAIGVVCGNSEIENYRKAAEQGDAVAQRKLGYRYGNGIGVKQDHAEAFKWYRKAAEQGDNLPEEALKNNKE